jgi:hypothetical protein
MTRSCGPPSAISLQGRTPSARLKEGRFHRCRFRYGVARLKCRATAEPLHDGPRNDGRIRHAFLDDGINGERAILIGGFGAVLEFMLLFSLADTSSLTDANFCLPLSRQGAGRTKRSYTTVVHRQNDTDRL